MTRFVKALTTVVSDERGGNLGLAELLSALAVLSTYENPLILKVFEQKRVRMGAYVRPSKEMEVSLLFHPKDEN
jgi:hypothetical protein